MSTSSQERTLGTITISENVTLLFSSSTTSGPTRDWHEGDYVSLFPYWYRVSAQGSLQVAAKTAIPIHQMNSTPVKDWKRELEALLGVPLSQRLHAWRANLPYTVFFDYRPAGWHEDIPASFPPNAYVYLNPFFYTTDKHGRLQVLAALSLETTPPEEWADHFKHLTGIAPETRVIPLAGSGTSRAIEALWRHYKLLYR